MISTGILPLRRQPMPLRHSRTTTTTRRQYHHDITLHAPIGLFNLLQPFRGASTKCTLYRACIQLLQSGGAAVVVMRLILPQSIPRNHHHKIFYPLYSSMICVSYPVSPIRQYWNSSSHISVNNVVCLMTRFMIYTLVRTGQMVVTITTQHTLAYRHSINVTTSFVRHSGIGCDRHKKLWPCTVDRI